MKYTLTTSQDELQPILDSCDRCLIQKSVRSGKTLSLLHFINKNKYKKVLWLVPNTEIRDVGLPNEIKKWGFKLNIHAICYNSLKKYSNTDWDIVILDEIQMLNKNRFDIVSTMSYKKIVGMTGTIPNNRTKRDIIFKELKLDLVYKYTTQDAVNAKDVAPFNVNYILLPLSTDLDILVEYKDKITGVKKSFYTSEVKNYTSLSLRIDSETNSNRKMLLALTRLRFLNTLKSKVRFIKNYLEQYKDQRVLVFVNTREMAEQISKYFYHGTSDDGYFNDFKKGKINHLVLVNKGGAGENYENLDRCLLADINSSNDMVQQKLLRGILYRENYTAELDVLLSKNTIQKVWIETALKDLI